MNPVISVITAVYNDENFIRKSIESILNQTFTDFEYIIVNDGSTDSTPAILEELQERDKRIIVLNQKNAGAAAARNLAIHSAKGKYIAIQDSDDISSPLRLEKQLACLARSDGYTISCTGYNLINDDDAIFATHNKIYKNITQNVLNGNTSVCHPTLLIPSDLLAKTGGYNSFYSKTEDYDLILRLLENNARFDKINECLYNYRIRQNSESSMNSDVYVKRVYENHLNRLNNRPENYAPIVNKIKHDKNYVLKRQMREIFYSENYLEYRRMYIKNVFKLPFSNFFMFYTYSFLPIILKNLIKNIYNNRRLKKV